MSRSSKRQPPTTPPTDFINSGGKRYPISSNHNHELDNACSNINTRYRTYPARKLSLPAAADNMAEVCRPIHDTSLSHYPSPPALTRILSPKQPYKLHHTTATLNMASDHFRYSTSPPDRDGAFSASPHSSTSASQSMHSALEAPVAHADSAAQPRNSSTSGSDGATEERNKTSQSEAAPTGDSAATSATTTDEDARDWSLFILPRWIKWPRQGRKSKLSKPEVKVFHPTYFSSAYTISAADFLRKVKEKYLGPDTESPSESSSDSNEEPVWVREPHPSGGWRYRLVRGNPGERFWNMRIIPREAWQNFTRSMRPSSGLVRSDGRPDRARMGDNLSAEGLLPAGGDVAGHSRPRSPRVISSGSEARPESDSDAGSEVALLGGESEEGATTGKSKSACIIQ